MQFLKKRGLVSLAVGVCTVTLSTASVADIWVFEPSITLDQRFDDNYFLKSIGDGSLSATRAVGELGLSRESEAYVVKGLVRIDALLTTNTDVGEENLDSNQIINFDARRRTQRSRYAVDINFKQDTPSRDIAADISSESSLATDTGLIETQSLTSNVARRELTIEPTFEYDISRRLEFGTNLTLSIVEHDLPAPQDVIYTQYLAPFENGTRTDEPLPYDQVTIDTPGVGVFSPSGELDDYREAEVEFDLRYKFTPIVTLSASAGYSRFNADVEPDPAAIISFDDLIPDPQVPEIRRKARRESISTTSTFKLGYERYLTPTLQFAIDGGVYTNSSDASDTLRNEDLPDNPSAELLEQQANKISESDGWLASTSLQYDAGATRYGVRFSVDVQPSSTGAQVETNELKGEVIRTLSPRLQVALYGRAFEPDRLGAKVTDKFARRFISVEPRVQWSYSRNWTFSAAYRYRRQKARVDFVSAESNAILLAIKFTPPSEIRDRAQENGL